MNDKELKEMAQKLFAITLEVEEKEKSIENYENTNNRFAPLNERLEMVNELYKMYLICKEHLYR